MADEAWVNDGFSRILHHCPCKGLNEFDLPKSSGYMCTTNPGINCAQGKQCKAKPDMWQVREALRAASLHAAERRDITTRQRDVIEGLRAEIKKQRETLARLGVFLA